MGEAAAVSEQPLCRSAASSRSQAGGPAAPTHSSGTPAPRTPGRQQGAGSRRGAQEPQPLSLHGRRHLHLAASVWKPSTCRRRAPGPSAGPPPPCDADAPGHSASRQGVGRRVKGHRTPRCTTPAATGPAPGLATLPGGGGGKGPIWSASAQRKWGTHACTNGSRLHTRLRCSPRGSCGIYATRPAALHGALGCGLQFVSAQPEGRIGASPARAGGGLGEMSAPLKAGAWWQSPHKSPALRPSLLKTREARAEGAGASGDLAVSPGHLHIATSTLRLLPGDTA